MHLQGILDIELKEFEHPWTKNQILNDILSTSNSENLVYLFGYKVVGYLMGKKVLDEFHLHNIAVHSDYKRKKIGSFLINHLIEILLKQKIQLIFLEVSAHNYPAIKFYNKFGFKINGYRNDYYSKGDHAILYKLNLVKYGRMV